MKSFQTGNGWPAGVASPIGDAARPYNMTGKEIGMEWKDQYKHPNWQKKRLDRLQAAQWECENCGTKDAQLHVHHKAYFKGRLIWEYGDDELEVLCENCHKDRHEISKELKELLVSQSHHIDRIIGYIHGLIAIDSGLDGNIPVRNYEWAEGIADAFKCSIDLVIDLAIKNGKQVSTITLLTEDKKVTESDQSTTSHSRKSDGSNSLS